MKKDINQFHCSIEASMCFIGGKYKPIILWHIIETPRRFSELRRAIPHATAKMLTQQLRELEEDGLVLRKVFPVVPPHTEYSLTELGETLIPIVRALKEWGNFYFQHSGMSTPCAPETLKQLEKKSEKTL